MGDLIDEFREVKVSDVFLNHSDADDYICHFKYIARVPTGNSEHPYKYFYEKEEWENWKAKNQPGRTALSKVKDVYEDTTSRGFGAHKKYLDVIKSTSMSGKKSLKPLIAYVNLLRDTLYNKITNDRSKISDFKTRPKYVAKVKLPSGKYRYFYNYAEYESYLKRKEYQENEPEFMKGVPELDPNESWKDVLKRIGKNRNQGQGPNNCMLCTTAYELAQRGYDVSGAEMTDNRLNLRSQASVLSIYKDAKIVEDDLTNTIFGTSNIEDFVSKNSPPNSRGNLMVRWKGTRSGHSIAYEVDSLGNVRLVDGQINEVVSGTDELAKYSERCDQLRLVRTDNLELKEGILNAVEQNK